MGLGQGGPSLARGFRVAPPHFFPLYSFQEVLGLDGDWICKESCSRSNWAGRRGQAARTASSRRREPPPPRSTLSQLNPAALESRTQMS